MSPLPVPRQADVDSGLRLLAFSVQNRLSRDLVVCPLAERNSEPRGGAFVSTRLESLAKLAAWSSLIAAIGRSEEPPWPPENVWIRSCALAAASRIADRGTKSMIAAMRVRTKRCEVCMFLARRGASHRSYTALDIPAGNRR